MKLATPFTPVTITVTQDHVQRQNLSDHRSCAVALAIREHLSPDIAWNIRVTAHAWWLPDLPPETFSLNTQSFITSLDSGLSVSLPHTFTTKIPNEYVRTGDE